MSDDLHADPAAAILEQLSGIRQRRADKRYKYHFQRLPDGETRLPVVRRPRDYPTRPPNPGWAMLPCGIRLTVREVASILRIKPGTLYRNYFGSNATRPVPNDIFVTREASAIVNHADRVYVVRLVGKFASNIKRGVGT